METAGTSEMSATSPPSPISPPSAASPPSPATPRPEDLRARLPLVSLREAVRLGRRLETADRTRGPARARALGEVARAVAEAELRTAVRAGSVPALHYPDQLPVSARREEIAAAVRDHQVVVLAGETGSGKTTQLPKICLELGRGVRGMVGHTQPRRIAARAVAERLAEELDTEVGGPTGTVGYAVRFTDEVGPNALVKVMTDGILLAEVQRDRDLLAYDTIIIDEAHERSLTIDFLLGYLARLLPRRPDLKVVITSATIDPQRFADHFGAVVGEVPVVEVSGRTYPVEVRYRPLVEEAEASDPDDPDAEPVGADVVRDQTEGVLDAVAELAAQGPGDVLVFLSGEREIRDTADALARLQTEGGLRGTEVVPLFGRLSAAEQHRVFAAHTGRRVVLATNVAETSLTVPGIRYVVDTGTARISRYSARTKVQRLPIEPVSRASADQRAGRCGRVAEGICLRLYSEEDYLARPRFTDPEVQRTSLASVILQMTSLGLGEVADFPFIDPPDARQVRDGVALLHELGALDAPRAGAGAGAGAPDPRRLTDVGRRLAALPVDPRLGRMLVEGERLGVLAEVLVVVAGLSVQDVRERPLEHAEAAAASHRRFADEHSDFVSLLNLWSYLRTSAQERSSSAFRRMCRAEWLHYLRVREWQDLHAQLRRAMRSLGADTSADDGRGPAGVRTGEHLEPVREELHRALLSGLLSQVGAADTRDAPRGAPPARRTGPTEYLGARGARFAIAPGSVLARRAPAWVVAGELVETSRLWARQVARIDPVWAEQLAPHLVVRTHGEPRWDRRRGAVVATERVTLYGLVLVAARTVPYGRIDPETSRELFLRSALVEGAWDSRHAFREANARLAEQVEELAARARRRDLRVDDESLLAFYDARVPADVTDTRSFDAWWRRERRTHPDLLTLDLATVVADADAVPDEADTPTSWTSGSFDLDLSYRFEPGSGDDGVTVHVPLAVLDQVPSPALSWGVPGYRGELVTALLRALPKALRVRLVPVPDTARALLAELPADPPAGVAVTDALAELLRARRGVVVGEQDWDWSRVPEHLRSTYAVEDDAGRAVATGKDLDALRARVEPARRAAVRAAVTAASPGLERDRLQGWPGDLAGGLPEQVERTGADGRPVVGYPALVVEGAGSVGGGTAGDRADAHGGPHVALRVLASRAEAEAAGAPGLRRLVREALDSPARAVLDDLATPARLALARSPHGSAPALLADCTDAAVDALVTRELARAGAGAGAPGAGGVGGAVAFAALVAAVAPDVVATTREVLALVQRVLASAREVERVLDRPAPLSQVASLADARAQLAALVHPGFVAETTLARLPDVQRYLRALLRRLEVLATDPVRDRDRAGVVQRLSSELDAAVAALPGARRSGADVAAVRWQLQELRVSLFAQAIGTPGPVSDKRVRAAVAALRSREAPGAGRG